MQDSQVKVVMILLLALQTIPFFITHFLVSGFHYLEEEERKWVVRSSVPINILCNALVWGLTFSAIFRGHSSFTQLIRLQGSYQDAARLALCSVICIAISAIIAYGGVLAYLRGDREDLHLNRSAAGKVLLLVSLMIIPLLLGVSVSRSGLHHLVISGYCRKTVNYLYNDKTGESEEDNGSYVLIRNGGAFTVEAEGLYLSEDDRVLHNLQLKSVKLGPGESFRQDFTSDESLNVKKNGGSMIFLSDSEEAILDSVVIPGLKEEETFLLSDSDWKVVQNTSALEMDEDIITVAPPVFSAPGGFYDKEFELTLTSEPGTKIYYTLDGSDPTEDSLEYKTPIRVYDRSSEPNQYRSISNFYRDYLRKSAPSATPVEKAFLVRAVCVDAAGRRSTIQTHSFFINLKKFQKSTVVSLVSDPINLFDGVIGIAVTGDKYDQWYLSQLEKVGSDGTLETSFPLENYRARGKEWERPASFELFENGQLVLSQEVGIRLQGNSSRFLDYRKRFSIYARKEYSGNSYFDKTIIDGRKMHAIQTRSGDLHILAQLLCKDRSVETIDAIPASLFLDGEYWYSAYLVEKFNEKNLAIEHNLSEINVVIVRNSEANADAEKGPKPIQLIKTIFENNDMSTIEAYNKLDEVMDISSYIDMVAINVYLANLDCTEGSNNLVWHTIIPENDDWGDARWRWGLCDMDLNWSGLAKEYGKIPNYEINTFQMKSYLSSRKKVTEWPIFSQLRTNPEFCRKFVLVCMDLMNETFNQENTSKAIESLGVTNEKIISFFENRGNVFPEHLKEEFDLTSVGKVVLQTEKDGASIQINTLSPKLAETEQELPETMPWEAWKAEYAKPLPPYYRWEGKYFTDYPVTVSTEEPDFLRWEVTSGGQTNTFTDRTIEVPVVEGGVEIYAVFK